jgi:1-phosphofructokinase family hexose kinase
MGQPANILCVSANPAVDRRIILPTLRLAEINRATSSHPAAGGKAAHVAIAARTLGADVTWMALLGGPEGELCQQGVAQHGVKPICIPVRGHTRTNLELCDCDRGNITEILEPGPIVTASEADSFVETFRGQLDNCPSVVISGSLPRGLTPDFYVQLIRLAKVRGCRVLLDTSGDSLSRSLEAGPDVIKPNRQEASALVAREIATAADAIEAASELRAKGVAVAILSLGDQGAVVATEKTMLIGLPPTVRAKSTVGSGDCFLAGWAVAQAQGKDPSDCMRIAIACGTANCLAESPAHIDLAVVKEFLATVRIEEA